MRITIATDGNAVSQHFGHCAEFTIVEVDGRAQKSKTVVPNAGHEGSGAAAQLASLGVNLVISGGMGAGAVNRLASYAEHGHEDGPEHHHEHGHCRNC